ncbi:hypothetical protein [Nonomuraea sp. WAC 01424]|uniref:hypothetical protein n=1 Tax=Nonomuraea sp. WAC 01424 TaxID=2203200 RepID=UPI00163C6B5E|nr:hypothetical protein [Nonomuraea sp. WAC 01424]
MNSDPQAGRRGPKRRLDVESEYWRLVRDDGGAIRAWKGGRPRLTQDAEAFHGRI